MCIEGILHELFHENLRDTFFFVRERVFSLSLWLCYTCKHALCRCVM